MAKDNNIFLYGALAAGGWWLWQSGMLDSILSTGEAVAPAGSPQVPPVSGDNGQPPPSQPPPPPAVLPPAPSEPPITAPAEPATVKQQVLASGGPMDKSFWRWNAIWMQVTGNVDAPDPKQLGDFQGLSNQEIENRAMSLDQWWSYMGQFGLTGISGMGRAMAWY